jgi:DNA polymerase-3 subunit delta'
MSATAERTRSAVIEPDRLDLFSTPRDVDRVFGHDAAIAEFERARASGRMHHAWLLVGPDGVGKATLAYHFARTVLGQGEGIKHGDVPAEHPLFRKVAGLAHPNFLLIRRSWIEKSKKYSQWIGVDEVRRLRAFLGTTSGEDAWRVVVVDRADELNQNAANALLKALEEPPPRTLFLMVAGVEGRLPITIRSRSRVLRLGALDEASLKAAVQAALTRDGVKADPKALDLALALSEGSVRRALELVSSGGIGLYEQILAMFALLPEVDGAELHNQTERVTAGNDLARLELYLALMRGVIERMTRFTAMGSGALGAEKKLAARLVSPSNLDRWAEAWEVITEARNEAFTLNLDRNLLVLNSWFLLQELAREDPV